MIATGVASPFLTPFKLSLVLAIFMAIPVILYQVWGFVAPGLYQRSVLPLLASACCYLCRRCVCPALWSFHSYLLSSPASDPTACSVTDINSYLDFVLEIVSGFWDRLRDAYRGCHPDLDRGHQPGCLSQKTALYHCRLLCVRHAADATGCHFPILLAIPMWLLFELGVLVDCWSRNPEPPERW